ncbi:hypothetical protein C8R43DRAFT_818363, partial [Mycena crocata]
MLAVARKFGIKFDTNDPPRDVRELLPLWHHFGEDPSRRQLNNKPQCKCLRENHNVNTVGEGLKVMARLTDPAHYADKLCVCENCYIDRTQNSCKNPHSCALTVQMRLDQILPKWDPRQPEPHVTEPDPGDTDDMKTFVPPRGIHSLTEGFRVFSKEPPPDDAGLELQTAAARDDEPSVTVYTSGNTVRAGTADAQAGVAVWFGPEDDRNFKGKVSSDMEQSSNSAEIVAALVATRKVPIDTPLRLESE